MFHAVPNVYWFMSLPTNPETYMLSPSGEKKMPDGAVSCAETEKTRTYDAVEMFHAVPNVYWFTSLPVSPRTYMLSPSGEKKSPCGTVSWALTLKLCTNLPELSCHAGLRSYSCTASEEEPHTYSFKPSDLKNRSVGELAWLATTSAPYVAPPSKVAWEISHPPAPVAAMSFLAIDIRKSPALR